MYIPTYGVRISMPAPDDPRNSLRFLCGAGGVRPLRPRDRSGDGGGAQVASQCGVFNVFASGTRFTNFVTVNNWPSSVAPLSVGGKLGSQRAWRVSLRPTSNYGNRYSGPTSLCFYRCGCCVGTQMYFPGDVPCSNSIPISSMSGRGEKKKKEQKEKKRRAVRGWCPLRIWKGNTLKAGLGVCF